MYDYHLRLIEKRIISVPISVNCTFSLGVTVERANIGSKSAILLRWGLVDPKFQVEGVAPQQPFFFSENWAILSFVRYKNLDISFFRFVRNHAFVRQTDRRTD